MPNDSLNLWTIFLTGLLTGGLSCLAVQGGLLATSIAQREEEKMLQKNEKSGNALPIIIFLAAKLTAYTIFGFLLGWFGSLFELSLTLKILMQFTVVIFMLGTALNILNIHPVFRYFVIQSPKFLTKVVRRQSKSSSLFAPAILGSFTVLIPCGTTQAMMALAIGSANPLVGAAILFSFVLGTSSLFFILGYFATKLSETLHQKFMKIAAYSLIILALFNLNGAVALTGSNLTFTNMIKGLWCTISICDVDVNAVNNIAVNKTTIEFNENSYSPNQITVKAGSNVKLNLVNNFGQGCIQAFTIPQLGIQKIVRVGTQETIEFTAPLEKGKIKFMCSMGMYQGEINVI